MEATTRGRFVVFEGGEGTGKTTQARILAERLAAAGIDAATVREPGGTPAGDRIRDILLDRAHTGLDPRAELLLYEASRAELVSAVIRPALGGGRWVLCDRFTDSTLAYQGYGRGLDLASVRALNELACGGLTPDLTVLIDLDPVVGLERATGGGADRLESEELAFHERIRAGFLEIAKAPGHVVIDGTLPVEAIADAVFAAVSVLGARGETP